MQATSDPAFDTVALSELHSRAWTLLEEGVRSARSPFHTPAMATQGASGPSVRTVVLRHADPEKQQISCHTDWRSAKRREIQKDGRVSWLFYDRDRKLQLRLAGIIVRHVASYGLPHCLRITIGDEAACRRVVEALRTFKAGAVA